jgi:hypothetical protein
MNAAKTGVRRWLAERRARRDASWAARRAAPAGGTWPRRVVYLSPDSTRPTGGVKVFYQHVEALCALGVDAYVMHERPGFRCTWFDSSAPVLCQADLRPGDEAVVPEVMPHVALRLRRRGVPYSLFVQNGYLALEVAPPADTRAAYDGARAVLAISEDTQELLRWLLPGLAAPLVRVRHSVDSARFQPAAKEALVTYMPRKMPQHARLVTGWLALAHPQWRFQALDGLAEAQVAQALGRSRIFLAFSEYEGLPLPPIEAALAGNVVLGYPGWGALEYWREPLFHLVPYGDVRAFAAAFAALVDRLAEPDAPSVAAARETLARTFDREAERAGVADTARRLGWLTNTPA